MRGGRARVVLIVLAAVVLAAVVDHRVALAQFRAAEATYLEGRQITACATAALSSFAQPGADIDELPDEVERLVTEAAADTEALRQDAAALDDGAPYPRIAPAVRGVRAAIDAQEQLYREMVSDPEASDDDLDALGDANRAAEARLSAARSVLFVGTTSGWNDRNTCSRPSP